MNFKLKSHTKLGKAVKPIEASGETTTLDIRRNTLIWTKKQNIRVILNIMYLNFAYCRFTQILLYWLNHLNDYPFHHLKSLLIPSELEPTHNPWATRISYTLSIVFNFIIMLGHFLLSPQLKIDEYFFFELTRDNLKLWDWEVKFISRS